MAYGHVLVGQYSFRIRSSISSTIVSLCDKEYLKIRFFIVLCSTFSGGLDVISGVNDFLISDKKGKKTSSSQTGKVSTSDLQLVLLEVLSLLFNTPPDLEVSGLSKWPRAVHLFIALFALFALFGDHQGSSSWRSSSSPTTPWWRSTSLLSSELLHPWKHPQIASLLTFPNHTKDPSPISFKKVECVPEFFTAPFMLSLHRRFANCPQVVPASGQTCAKVP